MNYEALGRYVEAKEKAEQLAINRNTIFAQLKQIASDGQGFGPGTAYIGKRFDLEKARRLLDEICTIEEQFLLAVHEANKHAEECGKQKLNIIG
ncbi:MAG: hypothetical protein K1Y36_10285 [Blastocatellia bacterium]|nr:hypothetical protein [Blastocatellia bacterium]